MAGHNPLTDIARGRAVQEGRPRGIVSVCSSNEFVLTAALERALPREDFVLIEATANQVNQFGGYTGMRPADFARAVRGLADRVGFPQSKLMLGGDHLGPLVWQGRKAEEAMSLSVDLVTEFIRSGFVKIHLDTSMRLGGDTEADFGQEVMAERGAVLCEACERAFAKLEAGDAAAVRPVYVIGSEVPIPGGIQNGDEDAVVTSPGNFRRTVETFRRAFGRRGLSDAWNEVVAVVVGLGVEFGNDAVHEYDRARTAALSAALSEFPGLTFEAHSTDYQTKDALRAMVEDGAAFLKVGPALTFALREALFALAAMEDAVGLYTPSLTSSRFLDVLEAAMVERPEDWRKHYHGSEGRLAFDRKYSFSGRSRYYLPEPSVQAAMERMIGNLRVVPPPLSLLSQYMPREYELVRQGRLADDPSALIKNRIIHCLSAYDYAVYGAEDG